MKEGWTCKKLGEVCVKMFENQRTKASKGDVLLTIAGTIGRTCVLKGDEGNITFQRSVAILKPSKEILSYYLMYYLLSQSSRLNTKAQGAAQKGIYLKQLGAYDISYPSIEEQQRIVSRLDAAFAYIDELKANAEKQLSEARVLFQKALTKAMEPKVGWEAKKLGIVSRLDAISAHIRELEEVLQKTIAECDALKQALLRKVFE